MPAIFLLCCVGVSLAIVGRLTNNILFHTIWRSGAKFVVGQAAQQR